MQQIQVFQFSPAEFFEQLEAASERGAARALSALQEQQAAHAEISTEEAMTLAGYSDPAYWRAFLKRNGIYALDKPGKRKWYRRSDIVNCKYPKGTHLK